MYEEKHSKDKKRVLRKHLEEAKKLRERSEALKSAAPPFKNPFDEYHELNANRRRVLAPECFKNWISPHIPTTRVSGDLPIVYWRMQCILNEYVLRRTSKSVVKTAEGTKTVGDLTGLKLPDMKVKRRNLRFTAAEQEAYGNYRVKLDDDAAVASAKQFMDVMNSDVESARERLRK